MGLEVWSWSTEANLQRLNFFYCQKRGYIRAEDSMSDKRMMCNCLCQKQQKTSVAYQIQECRRLPDVVSSTGILNPPLLTLHLPPVVTSNRSMAPATPETEIEMERQPRRRTNAYVVYSQPN